MADTVSSAVPEDLIHYASTARQLNAHLDAEAQRLATALRYFAATCTEVRSGIDEQYAAKLQQYVRQVHEPDAWVERVGLRFQHAGGGEALWQWPAGAAGVMMQGQAASYPPGGLGLAWEQAGMQTDAALYRQLASGTDQVNIVRTGQMPDGRDQYTVLIGGAGATGGLGSAYYEQVRSELDRLPPGCVVNLAGRGLGGIVARWLVHDATLRDLSFGSVTTFGLPCIGGAEERSGVNYRHYVEDAVKRVWVDDGGYMYSSDGFVYDRAGQPVALLVTDMLPREVLPQGQYTCHANGQLFDRSGQHVPVDEHGYVRDQTGRPLVLSLRSQSNSPSSAAAYIAANGWAFDDAGQPLAMILANQQQSTATSSTFVVGGTSLSEGITTSGGEQPAGFVVGGAPLGAGTTTSGGEQPADFVVGGAPLGAGITTSGGEQPAGFVVGGTRWDAMLPPGSTEAGFVVGGQVVGALNGTIQMTGDPELDAWLSKLAMVIPDSGNAIVDTWTKYFGVGQDRYVTEYRGGRDVTVVYRDELHP